VKAVATVKALNWNVFFCCAVFPVTGQQRIWFLASPSISQRQTSLIHSGIQRGKIVRLKGKEIWVIDQAQGQYV